MKKYIFTYTVEIEDDNEEEARSRADEYLNDELATAGFIEWSIEEEEEIKE